WKNFRCSLGLARAGAIVGKMRQDWSSAQVVGLCVGRNVETENCPMISMHHGGGLSGPSVRLSAAASEIKDLGAGRKGGGGVGNRNVVPGPGSPASNNFLFFYFSVPFATWGGG